jgi:hypothetical protein
MRIYELTLGRMSRHAGTCAPSVSSNLRLRSHVTTETAICARSPDGFVPRVGVGLNEAISSSLRPAKPIASREYISECKPLLLVGDPLVVENQHRIPIHTRFDRGDLVGTELFPAIDASDPGGIEIFPTGAVQAIGR